MTTTHTPGPWKTGEGNSIRATIDGHELQIAALFTSRFSSDDKRAYLNDVLYSQGPANARLIAAAPALAEALQRLLVVVEHKRCVGAGCEHYQRYRTSVPQSPVVEVEARAVLASLEEDGT